MNTHYIPSKKELRESTDGSSSGKKGISFKNLMYNGVSSVLGGFGGFRDENGEPTPGQSQPMTQNVEPSKLADIQDQMI